MFVQGRAVAVKAKQSPMVPRKRETDEPAGCSSSSIGVLKIPTRLAGAQALRNKHSAALPSKRPDIFHDTAIESPYKRVKSSSSNPFDGASPEQPAFVPISLSLGGLAAPLQTEGPRRMRGALRGPVRAPKERADANAEPQEELTYMSELKATLRARREAQEGSTGVSQTLGSGLKEIRDLFLDMASSLKNFTSEMLREEDDQDDKAAREEQAKRDAILHMPLHPPPSAELLSSHLISRKDGVSTHSGAA